MLILISHQFDRKESNLINNYYDELFPFQCMTVEDAQIDLVFDGARILVKHSYFKDCSLDKVLYNFVWASSKL
jgi:hypothetical protein